MKRILLFGKNGQLGFEMQKLLSGRAEVTALGKTDVDLADADALRRVLAHYLCDVMINTAAYTDVENAEREQALAQAVNAIAPGIMAEACKKNGALLVHFSTDYVFNGQAHTPYRETDSVDPINAYGCSKLAGEQAIAEQGIAHLIFRTGWVYDLRGKNFLTKLLGWARQQATLRVVTDQVGSPTWSRTLALVTKQALMQDLETLRQGSGLYHVAGAGAASRFDFARAVLGQLDGIPGIVAQEVHPAKTGEFPSAVTRPAYSVLDSSHFVKVFGVSIPAWQQSLQEALLDLKVGHGSRV